MSEQGPSSSVFGSADWFARQSRQIVDSARALQSFEQARKYADHLAREWPQEPLINSALLSALVATYARPFSHNKVAGKSARPYSTRRLRDAPGFEKSLHRHLLTLRNKMVAHSDDDQLDGKFLSRCGVFSNVDDETQRKKVPLAFGAMTVSLRGILDQKLAERLARHIAAAAAGAESHVQNALGEYFRAATDYAEQCPGMDASKADFIESGVVSGTSPPAAIGLRMNDTYALKLPGLEIETHSYDFEVFNCHSHIGPNTVITMPNGDTLVVGLTDTRPATVSAT